MILSPEYLINFLKQCCEFTFRAQWYWNDTEILKIELTLWILFSDDISWKFVCSWKSNAGWERMWCGDCCVQTGGISRFRGGDIWSHLARVYDHYTIGCYGILSSHCPSGRHQESRVNVCFSNLQVYPKLHKCNLMLKGLIQLITGVEQPKFDFQVHYWLSTFFAPSSTFLGKNKYI